MTKKLSFFLKWPKVEVIWSLHWRDIGSQSCDVFSGFSENIILERLLLLNKLSKWPQLGLILKRCVCSLKWAQVKVICSICLGNARFWSDFVWWKMLNLAFTTHVQKKMKLSKNYSVEHSFSSYFCFIYLNTMQIQIKKSTLSFL